MRIIGAGADGIPRGVDEAIGGRAAGRGLLVDEGGEASPQRRGATGPPTL